MCVAICINVFSQTQLCYCIAMFFLLVGCFQLSTIVIVVGGEELIHMVYIYEKENGLSEFCMLPESHKFSLFLFTLIFHVFHLQFYKEKKSFFPAGLEKNMFVLDS